MAPGSLSIWIQRAGRAGRRSDIQAVAILLIQPSVFAEKNKSKRNTGEPIEYVKTLEAGLRAYVDVSETRCRRDIADEYFANPPGRTGMYWQVCAPRMRTWLIMINTAPMGECCDNCTRRAAAARQVQLSQAVAPDAASNPRPRGSASTHLAAMDPEVRFHPSNWRSFLQNIKRKDQDVQRATKMLQHWRRLTWLERYNRGPFGANGILADEDIATLAARHTYASVDDLRPLGWLLVDDHGPEILAILALVDMPAALAELERQRTKFVADRDAAIQRELDRLETMRLKREREEERIRKRHQREVEAEERKVRAEEKRKRSEHRKAVAPWRAWFARAAQVARNEVRAGKTQARKRKRAATEEEPAGHARKARRGGEENLPPTAVDAQSSAAAFVGPSSAPCAPTRPQPRPRRVARVSAPTVSTLLGATLDGATAPQGHSGVHDPTTPLRTVPSFSTPTNAQYQYPRLHEFAHGYPTPSTPQVSQLQVVSPASRPFHPFAMLPQSLSLNTPPTPPSLSSFGRVMSMVSPTHAASTRSET